jgi:uncharacterized protein DUF5655
MVQKWVAELKGKTGRSVEEWVDLVRRDGPPDNKGRREWLTREFGLGTNSAWWLADRAEGKGAEDGDPAEYLRAAEGYVEAMFGGSKAGLRPVFDRLLDTGLAVADDVKASPGKTIVPLYRRHVFAQIKPTTRTRIDLGLALGKEKARLPKRLIDTGGREKGDRITHRIAVERVEDVDDDLRRWLKRAYDLDAG